MERESKRKAATAATPETEGRASKRQKLPVSVRSEHARRHCEVALGVAVRAVDASRLSCLVQRATLNGLRP